MKPSTKDRIKGKVQEIKGRVKEVAGRVTDNPNLAADGYDEKLAGRIRGRIGQLKKVLGK